MDKVKNISGEMPDQVGHDVLVSKSGCFAHGSHENPPLVSKNPHFAHENIIVQSSGADETFDIHVGSGESLSLTFICCSPEPVTNRVTVSLDGPGAECTLRGLYVVKGSSSVDFHVKVIHNAPECHSNQLFKGILYDNAVARFSGLVNVVPGAQKTEAYQACHNILLSPSAKAHAEPQLEIYADDVQCSHGATIGQLSDDEMFYLRSRGIPEPEARRLIVEAFAAEILDTIPSENRPSILF